MKKQYKEVEVFVIYFEKSDIVTLSDATEEDVFPAAELNEQV